MSTAVGQRLISALKQTVLQPLFVRQDTSRSLFRRCLFQLPRELLERHRLIVLLIGRCIHQRDRFSSRALRQLPQRVDSPGFGQLLSVTCQKIYPLYRIVSEPFAECGTWGELFPPFVNVRHVLADPARPDTIDQNSEAISLAGLAVDALNSYHSYTYIESLNTLGRRRSLRVQACHVLLLHYIAGLFLRE